MEATSKIAIAGILLFVSVMPLSVVDVGTQVNSVLENARAQGLRDPYTDGGRVQLRGLYTDGQSVTQWDVCTGGVSVAQCDVCTNGL